MERITRGIAVVLCAGALVATPAMAADVSTKGGITVKSDDGNFQGTFGGRLMLDAAVFDNDGAENRSGTEFRRLRLGSKGKIYGLGYKIEIDFAGGDTSTKDAYLQLPLLGGDLTVGQFRQYFTMEELTSSRHITFMERSFVTSFAPSRKVGVGFWSDYGPVNYGVSAYNAFEDEDQDGGPGVQEGLGSTARVIFGPQLSEGVQLHVGASALREAGLQGRTRVRVRPAGHLSNASRTTLLDINTGERVESLRFGIEGAAVAGPLSLQMEYVDSNYETDNIDQDAKAYYMYASYFLTGESRPYKASSGTFGRIKPRKAHGAYEVAVRYDYAEADNNTVADLEVEAITVGANWYMNPQVRFMLNYITSDVAEGADQPDAVTARVMFDF